MIIDALEFLSNQMNNASPPDGPKVELGNISRYNDGDDFSQSLQNKILLSIINIEEDTAARQVEHFRKENNQILFANPPIHINLSLMFASTHTNYSSAVIALEQVMLFFQQNPFFSADSSTALAQYNELHDVQIEKIIFEMVSMGLEQLHQLWSGLGGHYMPSVIYRMRMLRLDAAIAKGGQPIKEIRIDSWHKKNMI
jgi:hypothetical protein